VTKRSQVVHIHEPLS